MGCDGLGSVRSGLVGSGPGYLALSTWPAKTDGNGVVGVRGFSPALSLAFMPFALFYGCVIFLLPFLFMLIIVIAIARLEEKKRRVKYPQQRQPQLQWRQTL